MNPLDRYKSAVRNTRQIYLSNYEEDKALSTKENPVYVQKGTFTDSIYTRGLPYKILNKKR